jgi:hypothetical protein
MQQQLPLIASLKNGRNGGFSKTRKLHLHYTIEGVLNL